MARRTADPIPLPERGFSLSINELQNSAIRGVLPAPRLIHGEPIPTAPTTAVAAWGTQDIVNLADDLLLVRSNVHSTHLCGEHGASFDIDTRGWLYVHFRLDGISLDRLPDGAERTVSGGSFVVCGSARPTAFTRQVLSDAWQVVTVACRPSDMLQNLPVTGATLPSDLRRFRAGDADVDFFYASPFTPDMRLAAGALLKPVVSGGMQPFYLRAKAVELVCLAVEHVGRPSPQAEPSLKLSHRDVRALEDTKRLVEQATTTYSLDQLARRAGINRRKLALGFKLLFGVTLGELQREVRLELARRMLDDRSASVAYAATAAGYSDVGSFGKAFKARFGELPSQRRRTARSHFASQKSNAGPKSE